jgi:hypothetical protein
MRSMRLAVTAVAFAVVAGGFRPSTHLRNRDGSARGSGDGRMGSLCPQSQLNR